LTTTAPDDLVADSAGGLCDRMHLRADGCCAPSDAVVDVCAPCQPAFGCCTSLPRCVACCLAPANDALRAEVAEHAVGHPAFRAGVLAAPEGPPTAARNFTLCQARCRTGSSATIHENRYRSAFKHCYGLFVPPLDPAA